MELTGFVDDTVAGSETLPVGEEQQKSQEQLGKELENEVVQDDDQEQLEAPMSESAWAQSLSNVLPWPMRIARRIVRLPFRESGSGIAVHRCRGPS